MKLNSLVCIVFSALAASVFAGCDMGTYEERLERRIDDMREAPNSGLPEHQQSGTSTDSGTSTEFAP